MSTPTESGVGHLQNVEVVEVFSALLQCLSLSLEAGWSLPLGKKEQKLWDKVWDSSSGGHISVVDIDGIMTQNMTKI